MNQIRWFSLGATDGKSVRQLGRTSGGGGGGGWRKRAGGVPNFSCGRAFDASA